MEKLLEENKPFYEVVAYDDDGCYSRDGDNDDDDGDDDDHDDGINDVSDCWINRVWI